MTCLPAVLAGVSDHRIAGAGIACGLRICGQGAGMIAACANRMRMPAVQFGSAGPVARDIGAHRGPGSGSAALACGG